MGNLARSHSPFARERNAYEYLGMFPIARLFLWFWCTLLGSRGYAAAADYCHMELPLYRGDLALRPDVASIPVHLDLRVKDLVGNQCNVVGCWLLTVE